MRGNAVIDAQRTRHVPARHDGSTTPDAFAVRFRDQSLVPTMPQAFRAWSANASAWEACGRSRLRRQPGARGSSAELRDETRPMRCGRPVRPGVSALLRSSCASSRCAWRRCASARSVRRGRCASGSVRARRSGALARPSASRVVALRSPVRSGSGPRALGGATRSSSSTCSASARAGPGTSSRGRSSRTDDRSAPPSARTTADRSSSPGRS